MAKGKTMNCSYCGDLIDGPPHFSEKPGWEHKVFCAPQCESELLRVTWEREQDYRADR
jgi:hypothetical protein